MTSLNDKPKDDNNKDDKAKKPPYGGLLLPEKYILF